MKRSGKSALVVGGGVIGLASAFRLARADFGVTLFDPTPGMGATRAAAGMVAASAEITPGEEENYRLQSGALGAWRALAVELSDVTGRELTLMEVGTLLVGWDQSDRRLVDQYIDIANEFGVQPRRVGRDEEPAMFEGVSGRINDGLYLAGDAWVNPDQVVDVLREANGILGVDVVNETVTEIGSDGDGVRAVTSSASFDRSLGLVATGVGALPRGVESPSGIRVRPIHGITVRVSGVDRSDQPMIRSYVRGRSVYMVSRPGGYNVLGATSEERSESTVQVGELERLLRDVLDVMPDLDGAAVLETRSGLRPASDDLRPFFEILAGGRWAWSSGHFRHGVTLAPLAAREALRFAESVS
ncbi:MAG TPA: FAD-dependent oxidoreductase [Acidimicrobiales bacterium]